MRRYGTWAGNPEGTPEDKGLCIIEVVTDSWFFHQCQRKRGYGEGGLFCKQHARLSPNEQRLRIPRDKEVQ
jgi:hypothetical protein